MQTTTKKKVRYIGKCKVTNKYGELEPGKEFEVEEDEYYHFVAMPNFEDAEPEVIHMVAVPKRKTVFKRKFKEE